MADTSKAAVDRTDDPLREALDTIHQIIADAKKERDRYGYIAATIRVNALRAGASDEETEAMVRGDKPFIDWLAKQYEAKRLEDAAAPQPAPAPADERAAMAEAMADASESCCYMSDIYRMTDALLVKGFGLRGGAEAGLREALLNIRELNMTATDEDGRRWAQSDLIEQEIVAALAAAPQPAPAPADERAAMIEVMDRAFSAWVETSFDSPQMEYLADALLTAGWTRGTC